MQLTDAILALQPDAKFSVWDVSPDFSADDDDSVTRFNRFGKIVCWNVGNPSPCPTEEELES